MSPTCQRAVRSFRACERLNLIQAISAHLAGRPVMTTYHRRAAADFRRSARSLQLTSR